MGVRTKYLPAIAVPSHVFYCPQSVFLLGFIVAALLSTITLALFDWLEIPFILFAVTWHVTWAGLYRVDPWVVEGIVVRYQVGLLPYFQFTKNLIKENGWKYGC